MLSRKMVIAVGFSLFFTTSISAEVKVSDLTRFDATSVFSEQVFRNSNGKKCFQIIDFKRFDKKARSKGSFRLDNSNQELPNSEDCEKGYFSKLRLIDKDLQEVLEDIDFDTKKYKTHDDDDLVSDDLGQAVIFAKDNGNTCEFMIRGLFGPSEDNRRIGRVAFCFFKSVEIKDGEIGYSFSGVFWDYRKREKFEDKEEEDAFYDYQKFDGEWFGRF